MSELNEIKVALEQSNAELAQKFSRIDELETEVKNLGDELVQIQQKGVTSPSIHTKSKTSLGAKVWEQMQENEDLLGKTGKVRLEVKAAGDALTTSDARNVVSTGVGSPSAMILGVQNAFQIVDAGGESAAEYSRYTGIEGAADVQGGEGTAKSAVRPTFSLVSQNALTVAGYTKLSKQSLKDAVDLQNAVNITLQRSVGTALDDTLMNGSVTPSFSGLLSLATAATGSTGYGVVDATSEGVADMQEAGFQPDTVVLSPATWLSIQTAKDDNSAYLSGSYLGPMPENMRGLRVIVSPQMTVGSSMVIDSAHIELRVSDAFAVEVGYENDDFTKNIATLLGEMRVIPVFRAVGAARLITPN